MDISAIQERLRLGDYRVSDHAIKRMLERTIERSEIEEAVGNGVIIEEYPDDKYAPSCLIYGQTRVHRDLHVQVSMPPKVVIITTYEPDSTDWIDCKIRR